jgi:HEAT repeat protein
MALGKTRRREACEPLGEVMADADRTLRATAARALGLIEDPKSVAILKTAATDPKGNVRMWALRSLGAAGRADAADLLGKWVRTGRTWERYYAIEGLGLTGAEAAVPHLAVALGERRGTLRWAAARALVELGFPSGVEPLLAAAKRESLIGPPPDATGVSRAYDEDPEGTA